VFHQNVGWLSTDYVVFYSRKYNYSKIVCL
jgi:hypothetical protein